MQVAVFENAEEMGTYAARLIRKGIEAGRIRVLGLATGSSPMPLYEELRKNPIPGLSELSAFALDEYIGLPVGHPESYGMVIHREVVIPLGMNEAKVHVPNGAAADLELASREYEESIRAAGGIDFQILGIGSDGHIGFNEPTSSFASRTRIKTLTAETRAQNSRFFNNLDEVPKHCITQGLGTIMEARQVILMAQGAQKAAAVAAAVEGPISSRCPASILQMHPDATMILDEKAASKLELREYYDYIRENLPDGQR